MNKHFKEKNVEFNTKTLFFIMTKKCYLLVVNIKVNLQSTPKTQYVCFAL